MGNVQLVAVCCQHPRYIYEAFSARNGQTPPNIIIFWVFSYYCTTRWAAASSSPRTDLLLQDIMTQQLSGGEGGGNAERAFEFEIRPREGEGEGGQGGWRRGLNGRGKRQICVKLAARRDVPCVRAITFITITRAWLLRRPRPADQRTRPFLFVRGPGAQDLARSSCASAERRFSATNRQVILYGISRSGGVVVRHVRGPGEGRRRSEAERLRGRAERPRRQTLSRKDMHCVCIIRRTPFYELGLKLTILLHPGCILLQCAATPLQRISYSELRWG